MSEANEPKRRTNKPRNAQPANTGSRGPSYRQRTAICWNDIPADRIGRLIQAVTQNGPAIMCGRTSDGGALSITILDGDERVREWPHTAEEFDSIYDWAVSVYELG